MFLFHNDWGWSVVGGGLHNNRSRGGVVGRSWSRNRSWLVVCRCRLVVGWRWRWSVCRGSVNSCVMYHWMWSQ